MGKLPLSELRAASLSGRSPLYRWMLDHATEMEVAVSHGRPHWPSLARTFGDAGLFDSAGNPPSAEVARQTWFKVRRSLQPTQPKPARQVLAPIARGAPEDAGVYDAPDDEFFTISGDPVGKPR